MTPTVSDQWLRIARGVASAASLALPFFAARPSPPLGEVRSIEHVAHKLELDGAHLMIHDVFLKDMRDASWTRPFAGVECSSWSVVPDDDRLPWHAREFMGRWFRLDEDGRAVFIESPSPSAMRRILTTSDPVHAPDRETWWIDPTLEARSSALRVWARAPGATSFVERSIDLNGWIPRASHFLVARADRIDAPDDEFVAVFMESTARPSVRHNMVVVVIDRARALVVAVRWARLDEGLLGFSLVSIGDFDGDGHGDVLAGAPFSTNAGLGKIHVLSGRDLSTLRESAAIEGGFGIELSRAADFSSDPGLEVAVGSDQAHSVSLVSISTGDVLRRYANPNPDNMFSFGNVLAPLPDLDGDGFAELMVGHDDFNEGDTMDVGVVYVFSGASGRLLETILPQTRKIYGQFGQEIWTSSTKCADGSVRAVVAGHDFAELIVLRTKR